MSISCSTESGINTSGCCSAASGAAAGAVGELRGVGASCLSTKLLTSALVLGFSVYLRRSLSAVVTISLVLAFLIMLGMEKPGSSASWYVTRVRLPPSSGANVYDPTSALTLPAMAFHASFSPTLCVYSSV